MHLVRDVLDRQLVDRTDRPMGRVDGIVIAMTAHEQPELVAIEVGAVVTARRLHARFGRAVGALLRRFGGLDRPYRIPWVKLDLRSDSVHADLVAEDTPVLSWERWLRDKVIDRIPGAG